MKDNKHIKSFNEATENFNISDVSDSSKTIAIDFAKWIADNKWYKQIRYGVWEKSGFGSKSTSELFDMFIYSIKENTEVFSFCDEFDKK